MQINLSLINASPHPIRTTWDEDKLNELAQSLKEQGLITPIKVRSIAGGYEIVYGHRRVEAARRAGFTDIEATVDELDDQQTLIQALIENVQREDMSPLDTARGLKALKDATGWSQHEIARQGIMEQTRASQLLALISEPEEIQEILKNNSSLETHARLARQVIPDNTLRTAVLKKAASEQLSSAQTRRVAESVAAAPGEQAQQVLLERPYSEYTHDPELIKERAGRLGAHDPLYTNMGKSTLNNDWQNSPEVSSVLATLKAWEQSLAGFKKTDELGKMSPEARQFISRRIRGLTLSLIEWANQLENDND